MIGVLIQGSQNDEKVLRSYTGPSNECAKNDASTFHVDTPKSIVALFISDLNLTSQATHLSSSAAISVQNEDKSLVSAYVESYVLTFRQL